MNMGEEIILDTVQLTKADVYKINKLIGMDGKSSVMYFSKDNRYCLHPQEIVTYKKVLFGFKLYLIEQDNYNASVAIGTLTNYINSKIKEYNFVRGLSEETAVNALHKLCPTYIKFNSKPVPGTPHWTKVVRMTNAGRVLIGLASHPDVKGQFIK